MHDSADLLDISSTTLYGEMHFLPLDSRFCVTLSQGAHVSLGVACDLVRVQCL